VTLLCPPGSDEHRVFSDPGSDPRLCPTSQKVKSGWVGMGRGGVVGRGSGRRRGFGAASWVGLSLPRWHSRAVPLHEVALPCDFRPQNRTNLPPRRRGTPENARNCHLDRQPRHPSPRGGIPVQPHFTKWHSCAISDPKTAQTCHLAGGAPPKTHETATSTDNPAIPAPEVALPCGPASRSGTPVRFQPPKPHETATSRAEHPRKRTNLPPRGRGTPENARNCHLDPKIDDAGAPFGSVGWRLPDTEEFSVVRWWLSPHLLEVNGSGSGNRHPVQGGAGRGNQPRPRATAEAPRHRRNRAGSTDSRGARPKPCPPEAPPNHPRRTPTEPNPPHAPNLKSNPAHPHQTRPGAHAPNATARQLKGNRELVPRSSHLARRGHRMRSSVQNSLGWSTVCHLRVARANYAEE
jgi:hypothetical protein